MSIRTVSQFWQIDWARSWFLPAVLSLLQPVSLLADEACGEVKLPTAQMANAHHDIYGNTAFLGDRNSSIVGFDGGAVHVFQHDGAGWERTQILLPSGAGGDFGGDVDLEGDLAVVSATGDSDLDTNSGAVYVYQYDGATWLEQQKLYAGDAGDRSYFGEDARFLTDTIVATGVGGDDGLYKVYLFRFDGNAWFEDSTIAMTADPNEDVQIFGRGNILVIEVIHYYYEPFEYTEIALNIFRYDGEFWRYEQTLPGVNFWDNGAAWEDTIVVGSGGFSNNSAVVFGFDGVSWSETQTLTASGPYNGFNFSGIALYGDTMLVGARYYSEINDDGGAAYVFRHDGTAWQEADLIVPEDNQTLDEFGGGGVSLWADLALLTTPKPSVTDSTDKVYFYTGLSGTDCNVNAQADGCDILVGASADVDVNGIPDECEVPPVCEGDANGDGTVDPLDAGYIQARFGCSVGTGDPTCDAADVNADVAVDPLDVGFVLARFGDCD